MAAEPGTRFYHLLQPIKDLSKVWNIEIADELERYIEEVSHLVVPHPEDGNAKLNFAEAALLIQGSTAIYSRKVELLYQLVYQALESVAKAKEGAAASKRGGKTLPPSGLLASIPETDELLTIDHLIKEGRHITLDPNSVPKQQLALRRVPLFLMPRDQADRRSEKSRISSCTVHQSGAFLLQESDATLLDQLYDSGSMDSEHRVVSGIEGPLVPAPGPEVQDLDQRLQELLRKNDGPVESPPNMASPLADLMMSPQVGVEESELPDVSGAFQMSDAPSDPWKLLDEHEVVGKDCPLQVGKTSRKIDGRRQRLLTRGLFDADSWQQPSDAEVWGHSGNAVGSTALPMLAGGHPVNSFLLSLVGQVKGRPQLECEKAGFTAAWMPFEEFFVKATFTKRRRPRPCTQQDPQQEAMDELNSLEPPMTPGLDAVEPLTPAGFQAHPFDEDEQLVEAQTPPRNISQQLAGVLEMSEEKQLNEDQRRQVAELESQILEAQQKYESTIRQHLQLTRPDGPDSDRGIYAKLYANVQRWQDQLTPVLKENESRPEFNIDTHSSEILANLCDFREGEGDYAEAHLEAIPFELLAEGRPRWEICRRFMTCLLLTNQGNLDIEYANEEERINGFRVKLLKVDKRVLNPIVNDQPQALQAKPAELVPLPAPDASGRPRKAAKLNVGGVATAASAVREVASPLKVCEVASPLAGRRKRKISD